MRFTPGDLVIKQTGGNIMKVIQYLSDGVCCAWISDNYNEKVFNENELIYISEYKLLTKSLKREDLINEILN
jgi:uncharacterized protein YodC (DUF2158 family)